MGDVIAKRKKVTQPEIDKVNRLVLGIKKQERWGRGLNAWLSEVTGYSPTYVGRVFKCITSAESAVVPDDKFLMAACRSCGVSSTWVLNGYRPKGLMEWPHGWCPDDAPAPPDDLVAREERANVFERTADKRVDIIDALNNSIIRDTAAEMSKLSKPDQLRVLAMAMELAEGVK